MVNMQQLISTPILFSGRPGIESGPADWLLVTEIFRSARSASPGRCWNTTKNLTLHTLSISQFTVFIEVDAM